MKSKIAAALTVLATLVATQASAQITFFENNDFQGRSFGTQTRVPNFNRFGFNDRASSAQVTDKRWEVCDDAQFKGRCVVLRPGNYPSLQAMGMNDRISSVRLLNRNERIDERRFAPLPVAPVVASQVTFYENDGFNGQSYTSNQPVNNFERFGFNDRASSVDVVGGSWQVCEDARFNGRCVVLRPGRYASLNAMGLNDRISSARSVNQEPVAVLAPDFRRRNNEPLYEANVTSVRAVMGTPEQRCWVEREQVDQERGKANVPVAIVGALLGGILGHQVGGGTGKDLATVGGAIAGAAVGSNVGRDGAAQQPQFKDVQRCENLPNQAAPQYWDVSYNFRGQEHRVQMSVAPGQTVTVNAQGEPRN